MSDSIGSVSVSVVPSAEAFWVRFTEQTRAGAVEAGRRAGNDWQHGFNEATRGATVKVKADTTQARAQLAALNKDSQGGLLKSLLGLAPALVPLAGAAALGGAALASMAVTGGLAVKGIQADIKDANAQGLKFAAGLATMRGDLQGLEQTSARGVLVPFEQSVAKLHVDMPALNADLAQSSKVLGDIVGKLATAAVGGEHTFAPALLGAEQAVDKLATRFESWATGPGGARFSAALTEDFKQVEPVIENVAGAVAHLVGAANGPGLAIVGELGTLAHILDEIPAPVLTTLVTGIAALKIAGAVSTQMDKLALSVRGVATAEGEAAAVGGTRAGLGSLVGTLGKVAAGYVGVSLAAGEVKQASQGGLSSLDNTTRHLSEAGNALGDLFTGHLPSFIHDLGAGRDALEKSAQAAQDLEDSYLTAEGKAPTAGKRFLAFVDTITNNYAGATRDAALGTSELNQKQLDLFASVAKGHAVYGQYSVAQATSKKYTDELVTSTSALADTLAQLHGQAASRTGVAELVGQYGQAQTAIQGNISATEKFLSLKGDQVETYHGVAVSLGTVAAAERETNGDTAAAIGLIHARIDALDADKAALAATAREQQNLTRYVSDSATRFGLSSQQVDTYTAALGLNTDAIARGGAALRQAEAQLGRYVKDIENGSTAMGGWIAAAATFAQSSQTGADKAQLLASALVAVNGDALSYQNTMVGAATANQQLVNDMNSLHSGVLNLKTGMLDWRNAAAGPVLADLQQLQAAAANAAGAEYQHELATKGSKQALSDAAAVYRNDTRGALIDEASQLGLTRGEAKKLADQYFHMPKNIKSQIQLLGADTTNRFLKGILQDLDKLSGNFHGSLTLDVAVNSGGGANLLKKGYGQATGGWVRGPGTETSDSIPRLLSNHEFVVNAQQAKRHGPLLEAINAGTVQGFAAGGSVGGPGGFVGVTVPPPPQPTSSASSASARNVSYIVAGQSYGSLRAAENAASRLFKAQVTLGLRIDGKDLENFRKSLAGTASQAHAAFESMLADANKLGISDGLAKALRAENHDLDVEISARDKVADRLKAVTAKLLQVVTSVRSATSGAFDVTQAGTLPTGGGVTFRGLEAQAAQQRNIVLKWEAGIRKLSKEGFAASATGRAMLTQLAEGGPSDYPQVEALLSASPRQLASLINIDRTINAAGQAVGSFVGGVDYGKNISRDKAQVRADDQRIDRLADKIGARLEKAVDRLDKRPIEIKVDGKVIARTTATGTAKNARRK